MNIEHEKVDIFWVHVIKAFSIVMVIIIHASADLFYEFGNIPEKAWIASVIYQSFARIGVPLFFMISGFLLLGKQENLGFFFRKRIMKLVLPLIFWSAFYVFWRIVFFKEPVDFWQTLIQTIQNESFPHLWFLYTMLAVYLTYPLLRLLVQYGTQTVQWYFVILWLVVLILFPSLEYYLGIRISDNLIGSMGAFSGYLGYPVLGYLLGKMPRHNRLVAAMTPVVLISPFATLLRTYIGTISSGQVNENYFHYLSPNVIFPAAASFYLVRVIVSSLENSWGNRLKLLTTKISQLSYGIYLVHPIFIQLLVVGAFGIKLSPFTGSPWVTIPLVTFASFILSFVVIIFLKKLQFTRFIIP